MILKRTPPGTPEVLAPKQSKWTLSSLRRLLRRLSRQRRLRRPYRKPRNITMVAKSSLRSLKPSDGLRAASCSSSLQRQASPSSPTCTATPDITQWLPRAPCVCGRQEEATDRQSCVRGRLCDDASRTDVNCHHTETLHNNNTTTTKQASMVM